MGNIRVLGIIFLEFWLEGFFLKIVRMADIYIELEVEEIMVKRGEAGYLGLYNELLILLSRKILKYILL